MKKIPLYQEVYQHLKNAIRTSEYKVGDFLPPEGELEQQYDVSRTTVRKVIEMLVADGYVEVRQGRGTRVLDFHSTQQLGGITSISETLRRQGMQPRAQSVYIDVVEASKHVAERLHIAEGDSVFRVQRVILADEIPMAIIENYISCPLAPGLQSRADEITSLYQFLEQQYQLHIEVAKDMISARSAEFSESQILNTRPGAALLTLQRVTYAQDIPITYDKTVLRADRYRFEIESKDRT